MIIPVIRDKGVVRIPYDFASAVPEFADLLDDPKMGAPYLAFVIYMTDPGEDNIYFNYPEELRKKKLVEALNLKLDLLKLPAMRAAQKEYQDFCKHNISYQFKNDYVLGMKKVAEYVRDTISLTDDNAKKYADVLSEMPKLLKGKKEIDNTATSEVKKKGVMKGQKETTLAEEENR